MPGSMDGSTRRPTAGSTMETTPRVLEKGLVQFMVNVAPVPWPPVDAAAADGVSV